MIINEHNFQVHHEILEINHFFLLFFSCLYALFIIKKKNIKNVLSFFCLFFLLIKEFLGRYFLWQRSQDWVMY